MKINLDSLVPKLAGVLGAVFVIFLATGAALPALPLHIHQGLGFSAFIVGLVSGAQFVASLLSRFAAGPLADRRGSKRTLVFGLFAAIAAGIIYLASLVLAGSPTASVGVLLIGRAIMGAAEGFVMTGAVSWGLMIAGPRDAGKAIAWIGTAMFVGLATGAPLGSLLFNRLGFGAIGIATCGMSMVALLIVAPIRGFEPSEGALRGAHSVFRAVLLPGVAIAGASVAYGVMTVFSVLLFVQRGWEPAWLSFTLFATALIVARTGFGGLPDRIGGAEAAMIFVAIQAAGMALIWLSSTALLGFVGAFVSGAGYSFVYPGLGIEAVRRAPAGAKASAMALYTAFIDVALGVLTPPLGLIANYYGLGAVFAVSAGLALCTAPMAAYLRATAARNRT